MSGNQLFSDDELAIDEKDVFQYDEKYEKHYNEYRQKEEMQTLYDRQKELKSLEDSDSSGLDDDDEMSKVTLSQLEHINTIVAAAKAGKSIEGLSFFPNKDSKNEPETKKKSKQTKKKKDEPYTLKDYMRDRVLKAEEGQDIVPDDPEPSRPKHLLSGIACIDDSDDSDGGDVLMAPVPITDADTEVFSNERIEALKAKVTSMNYRPDMTEQEKEMADRMTALEFSAINECEFEEKKKKKNKKNNLVLEPSRLPSSSGDSDGTDTDGEDEEGIGFVRKKLKEKAAISSISHGHKSYPSEITSSMRVRSTKRKDARTRKSERKEEIIAVLRAEVDELKTIKAKEFTDKLALIQKVSGQTRLAFNEEDLDRDFDPNDHDRDMHETYDQDYYQDDDDAKKPVFDYDELIDGDMENYDEYEVESEEKRTDHNSADNAASDDSEEDGEASEDTKPAEEGTASTAAGGSRASRRRGKKVSALKNALARKKPLFDPSQHDFDRYYDEYYGLDFEDVIGGDLKCRYKYKSVQPNNFGLSTEEILFSDDRELNRWYSLKKIQNSTRTVEEENRDRKVYRIKAANLKYKKKMLPSFYDPPEEKNIIDEAADQDAEDEKKKSKNLKKKHRKVMKAELEAAELTEAAELETVVEKRKRGSDNEGTDDEEQEPKPKREKHVTTTAEVMEEMESRKPHELELKNRRERKLRKREKERRQQEGLSVKTKADEERRHRNDLVVGDPYSTVLKLSDERLAAYGFENINKLKKLAAFRVKKGDDYRKLEKKDKSAKKKKVKDVKSNKSSPKKSNQSSENVNKNIHKQKTKKSTI